MVYTLKKYQKELETNPNWDIEPHFWYYALRRGLDYFRLLDEEGMTIKDLQSALYGEFVIEGKPILDGFIQDLNFNVKFLHQLIKKTHKETNE